MSWFRRHYGARPLHLLALLACFALAGYAASAIVFAGLWLGVLVWLVGSAIAHDLLLFPLYAIADRSLHVRRDGRERARPRVPWVNQVRVPAAISGLLLLIWFPLIFGLPGAEYTRSVGQSTAPYLGNWLLATGALFGLSAVIYALRLARAARQPQARSTAARP